jgi:hypothetical protein
VTKGAPRKFTVHHAHANPVALTSVQDFGPCDGNGAIPDPLPFPQISDSSTYCNFLRLSVPAHSPLDYPCLDCDYPWPCG